jgi:hypothetical protein
MTQPITITLSGDAQDWLVYGERGVSSESILSHLTGLNLVGRGRWRTGTPSDPSDLRRCRLLLKAVPEFQERFIEMATASNEWSIAVKHWEELCTLFDGEAPNWATQQMWSAPKTFQRMKELGL